MKSVIRSSAILSEGEDLKRAAEDGQLISTLAEKIPALIVRQVEKKTRVKIETLSGDLRGQPSNWSRGRWLKT